MRFVTTIHLLAILDSILSLLTAFVLGTLVGLERQYRQRSAGLRTNTLVAVGAAAFVDLGHRLAGDAEAVRVISYVVSGIGFLGAGVIMKEGTNIRGLNTAATLWCSAAIGAAAGADLLVEAALITAFVLAGNTLLRPVVARMERRPLDQRTGELRLEIRVTTDAENLAAARRHVIERLQAAQYPVADIDVTPVGEEAFEIIALLTATTAAPAELDAVQAELSRHPGIRHAAWESASLD